MKRIDEFDIRLKALIKEFADVPHGDLFNALIYYAHKEQKKANR